MAAVASHMADTALMVEQIWLAHAQVDILCSERLRLPLVRHAQALNEVGADRYHPALPASHAGDRLADIHAAAPAAR
jgi:hypothetical protein